MLPDRADLMWSAALVPETRGGSARADPRSGRRHQAGAGVAAGTGGERARRRRERARRAAGARQAEAADRRFRQPGHRVWRARIIRRFRIAPLSSFFPSGFGAVPQLIGGYGQSLSNLGSGNFPTAQVGVQFSLPMRNRTADAQAAIAVAEAHRLKMQQNQIEMAVEADVRNALQLVIGRRLRLDAAALARRSAEEQYASEQRQFQAGTSTVFLVLQRQTDLIAARGREVRARADCAEAMANLDRATARTLEAQGIAVKP